MNVDEKLKCRLLACWTLWHIPICSDMLLVIVKGDNSLGALLLTKLCDVYAEL